MSETTTETPTPEAPEPAPVVEAPTTETPVVTDPPAEQTDPEPPKPDRVERRIANLTRKMADEARLRQTAERERDAALALVQVGKETPQQPRETTSDIETRAAQIVAEREFNRRLGEIDATGKKEIGADAWEQAKSTMTGLGAAGNQAFLQALAETENPHKLFAHYADDTDALMELLAKPPAAMAAKLGRMDAQLSRPVSRPLSAAPPPPTKIQPSGVVPMADPYNYPAGMGMKEWSKMMDQHLPASLGGKKKVG